MGKCGGRGISFRKSLEIAPREKKKRMGDDGGMKSGEEYWPNYPPSAFVGNCATFPLIFFLFFEFRVNREGKKEARGGRN